MYCVNCGCKIDEGFNFCPGCGTEVISVYTEEQERRAESLPPKGGYSYNFEATTNNSKSLSQADIERIADEIFWRCPLLCGRKQTKELAKISGISYDDASDILTERGTVYRRNKKLGKYPDTQYCPCCGSQDIEPYEESGIMVTSKANVFGGMYISSSAPSKKWFRCNMCGHRWRPKKRK